MTRGHFITVIESAKTVKIPNTITVDNKTYKVTSIAEDAFEKDTVLTKVTIGSNITSIGTSAFFGCKKLTTVTIGNNVTKIGEKAFYKCEKLKKITIPSRVSSIGKQAFYGCKKLKSITIKTTKLTSKKVGSKAFKGIYAKATIKVPKKKLNTYKKLLKSKGVGSKAKIKK
ncbi:MAG: leucine-rich repeat domain-containing protein [Lachnospiraceae bacterium]|nr:leucine-rich repeat domain-containing protein [Lachnospiraceae bacterium]